MISNNITDMKTMDNHDYSGQGNASLAVALIFGFISWIDAHSLGETLKNVSMVVSMGAGLMAIRYYYFSTKNIKNKKY